MNEQRIKASAIVPFPAELQERVDCALAAAAAQSSRKIIVLDDDPTGVQTVHHVNVYTDWTKDQLRKGFLEKNSLFFVLTNSRGFTVEQTKKAHTEIAENVDAVARELGREYLIISRGDSTLRGHYPLETDILRRVAESHGKKIDGEILCPYFHEGGRYTIGNVHYVRYGEELVPCGKTEFAKDETFGYSSSNLCEYVEEKTAGAFSKESVACISLEMLRALDYDAIEAVLLQIEGFNKVVVNAVDDYDVKVFATALYHAMAHGKNFTIRCAAALVKAIGNISTRPLLRRADMVTLQNHAGGIIVVGSHTKKTTEQLEELKTLPGIDFIEMDSDLVLQPGALEAETERILRQAGEKISAGTTVCISTKRTLLTVLGDTPEASLLRSVRISDAVQSCVGALAVTPAFVVAKGGITSSDVGTKALKVKCALVLGQIAPGVPVWRTGSESRFPGTPYVIFPGNVGEVTTLRDAVAVLMHD